MVEKKVTKGIAKHVTKQEIRHKHYKQCLFQQEQQMTTMKELRAFRHNIFFHQTQQDRLESL